MNMPSDRYFAGLIDGEGYIGVQRHKRIRKGKLRGFHYYPVLNVRMAHFGIVRTLKKRFGGSLSVYAGAKPNHKPTLQWTVGCQMACTALRTILPFLVVKKKQAQTALRLGDQIDRNKKLFRLMVRRTNQARHRLYKKLKQFNRVGK